MHIEGLYSWAKIQQKKKLRINGEDTGSKQDMYHSTSLIILPCKDSLQN